MKKTKSTRLTKRELIAIRAMEAIIAKLPNTSYPRGKVSPVVAGVALGAVDYADALLRELDRGPE